jgi:cell wall-associated NlpC family hydrolase
VLSDLTKLLGKKYARGGRGPDTFDCYGLALEVARRIGFDLPELLTPEGLAETDGEFWKQAQKSEQLETARPWCVVAFRLRPPWVTHVGIVLEDCRRFVHIDRKKGVCIERLDNIAWKPKIAGYYEYPTAHNKSPQPAR